MSEAGTHDPEDVVTGIISVPRQDREPSPSQSFDTRLKFGRRALLAVIASFLLLASACLISGCLAWRNIQATNAVMEARQTRRAETLVLDAVVLASSDQRGYLLTHDPAYLANYDAAKVQFTQSLAELRARLNTTLSDAQLGAVERLGAAIFADLDRTIVLSRAGRFDDAVAVVRSGTEKSLTDEFRQMVSELSAEASDKINRTTETESQLGTLLVGAIIAALVCVAGLAMMVLVDARRRFGMREVRETGSRQLAESLERRVAQRTGELAEANQRFDAALRASGVTVMTQDRDLVFTWISQGVLGLTVREVIGKPEHEVVPEAALAAVTNLKRSVIETGEPARGDIHIAHGGNDKWYDLTVHPLTDGNGATTGVITGAVDITRYKDQEARIRLLMRELTHRSKNLLTVIQAIMRQTEANCTSVDDFNTRFSARLLSLAGSHDLLVRDDWQGTSMEDLVRSQLGHYSDRADGRIELSGEPLQIPPDAAQNIGMALHELATNATKYGALSTPNGQVRISWQVSPGPDGTSIRRLSWEESGGPLVERPSGRGFGREVIERTVARALRGEVRIDYAASGLRWTLEFPRSL